MKKILAFLTIGLLLGACSDKLTSSKAEKLIQEALDELQRNKTVITIAHRLNTIQDMERIVVMDKGQVVSKGTHQELMKDCSLYRNMTETQEQVSKWQLKEEEE